MARSSYQRLKCPLCGLLVSTNGLAQTGHKKKHVRDGLMQEDLRSYTPEGLATYRARYAEKASTSSETSPQLEGN